MKRPYGRFLFHEDVVSFNNETNLENNVTRRGNHKKQFFVLAKICDKRGRILSYGHNSYVKTHPLQAKYAKKKNLSDKEFVHAEVMAITRLLPQHRTKAYSITVYRFDAFGRPKLAKPCVICQDLIRLAGIRRVYYTTDDNALDMSYPKFQGIQNSCECWN